MKIFYMFLIIPLFYSCLTAQIFSSETRKIEAENILNLVINSTPFDSIYKLKRVYFLTNELISKNSPLVVKRSKRKDKFLNEKEVKKVNQYIRVVATT